jgi:hypothetical protein
VSRPWLSIVTPSFNGGRYLRATFESVLPQWDEGIEWVLVDGGSTDDTASLVESYRSRLKIRVFTRPDLASWPEKTTFALQQARADAACMLHTDDLWRPGRAARLRTLLRDAPEAVLLLHPSRFVDESGRSIGTWRCPLPAWPRRLPPEFVLERLLVQNFVAAPGATFRRDVALASGGLDPRLWFTADWDLYLKLAAAGPTVYEPTPLADYRVHGGATTVSGSANPTDLRRQLELVFERHLPRLGPEARARVSPVARASFAVSGALAAAAHGDGSSIPGAAIGVLRLGPRGWRRFIRDSRIHERLGARLRHRLRRPRA